MPTLSYFILFAGLWAMVNGILHDVVILRQRRPFDRELIRLLIDGHVLIFGGILYLVCFQGIRAQHHLAFIVCIVAAFFLLGYCALIFKMLPSIATITINLIALVWLIIGLISAR
jgi:VIT1/CCC1 family predicted Fe2+/Mn2+ transporter